MGWFGKSPLQVLLLASLDINWYGTRKVQLEGIVRLMVKNGTPTDRKFVEKTIKSMLCKGIEYLVCNRNSKEFPPITHRDLQKLSQDEE